MSVAAFSEARETKRMAPEKLKYSKNAVQKAGKDLLRKKLIRNDPQRFKECMEILSNWRACHISALNEVTRQLDQHSKSEDRNSIVVARLKRTPSVITKLQRNPKMNLDRMQDIAGCRSIVKNPKAVEKIKKKLKKSYELREKDYISNPKSDGYRGIHLIGKHKNSEDGNEYQVEIQLRTQLQHAWATAVEIVDLFTNQTLKSNIGKKTWKDFFLHASNQFAKLERKNHDKNANSESELSRLVNQLNIYKKFDAFRISLKYIEQATPKKQHAYALIKIDTKETRGSVKFFMESKFLEATENYLEGEKDSAKNENLVVALVNVASIDNLKDAYPNYFADSSHFIENLRRVVIRKPNWITRKLMKWLDSTGLVERPKNN
ncbi:RelA/SpoT domain-containing protein [Microbulbifer agarilyticus]|uniref:RelA/SpoT domain-containing protein n=1 Tax=Microbulbifer agarilyticus TaxID=260552 RepID=UPI001CD1EBBA|nr:RelA/SpoT domain-containing protein [Microbulbifer agarilyticus]MCA0899128.1 RelA/SpoT domain-containing protein [Microbulbifer agarilyticus]